MYTFICALWIKIFIVEMKGIKFLTEDYQLELFHSDSPKKKSFLF